MLYEGKPVGTPDAGAFWRVIADHGVSVMFTAPTAIRAIKREDPGGPAHARVTISTRSGRCSWPGSAAIRTRWPGPPATSAAGDRSLVADRERVADGGQLSRTRVAARQARVADQAGARATTSASSMTRATSVAAGATGAVCVRLPLPPGFSPTLWQGDERFVDAYLSQYPGFYLTGDAGYFDEDGYLYVMSRIDDVINVAGHRLSTGQMEEVLASHPDVAECAVVGVADDFKGQIPIGFAVLKAGVERPDEEIAAELVALVRERVGPVASFKTVAIVDALPKTRSGKTLRATIRKIADGERWSVPPTIEDATVLDDFVQLMPTLHARGAPTPQT